MTAIPIPTSFVTPPTPVPSQAFGGVLELSQLLMNTNDDSKPVVCTECRTINLASAKLCKGCDGKLPGFYAAAGGSGGEPTSDPKKVTRAELAPEPRVRAYVNRLAPWSTVVWAAAVLIGLYVVFAIWYAAYSASTRRPAASQPMATVLPGAKPTAPAPLAAPLAEPSSVRTADALNVTLQSTPAANQPPVEAAAPPRSAAHVRESRADLPRTAPSASSESRSTPASYARGGSDPLAMCRGLNVFARAVCMNNSCAQRGSAGHPSCANVLRQRRLDEARRNPTMLN